MRSPDLTDRQATVALAILIGVSTVGCSLLSFFPYHNCYGFQGDNALYGYAFNQTLEGRLFPLYAGDGSLLGNHVNLIMVLWLPFFRVAPTMYSLFFFQSLMMSLAAWPVYLLTRDRIENRLTALIAAAGLLVFPPMMAHVNQIHDDQFGLVFLLFAVLFFERGNFTKFAVFMTISLLAKEVMVLNTIFFSVYALVRRRDWRWVVFPAIWSVGYFLLAWKVLLPTWGTFGSSIYTDAYYLGKFGANSGEVVRTILTRPGAVLAELCTADRVDYLWRFFAPLLLILPFGSWLWLVAVPAMAVNLLGTSDFMRSFGFHYGIVPGALLWCSFVCALPRWSRLLTDWFGGKGYARALCAVVLALSVAQGHLWFYPDGYFKQYGHEARQLAIRMIPREASVISPANMIAHFVRHRAVQSVDQMVNYRRDPNEVFDYDFVIFDGNYIDQDRPFQQRLFDVLIQHRDYHLQFSRDHVFVFQLAGTPERNFSWEAISANPTGGSDGSERAP